MSLNTIATTLNADDRTLRRRCRAGKLPVLLLTTTHLSGDLELLRPEWAPTYALAVYADGLSPAQEAEGRALCFKKLKTFRDSGQAPPGRLGYDFLHGALTWICGKDAESMHYLLNEQFVFGDDDPQRPAWTRQKLAPDREFHIAVIGAGESGLVVAHRLNQAGVPFTIYEKNAEVGGTWCENTYPGCRVDVNSFVYNYTFANKIWPEYFGVRDEVFAYLQQCAVELGLRERVRFNTEVVAATWDESTSLWNLRLRTAQGEHDATANVVVSGVGQLNRPSLPDIESRDSFAGPSFHSSRWDHGVDLKHKRVGVIGTGASGIQFAPHVARQAAHTKIFMRTVPWLLPTPLLHAPVDEDLRWLMFNVPNYAQWHRLFTVTPQMIGFYEAAIVDKGYPPNEKAVSSANDVARAALTHWIDAQIQDRPDLRPVLIPNSPPGAKRIVRDDGTWIATLKRDDVDSVTAKIERITEKGVRTADGTEHELDVLIYATGFETNWFLMPMKVTGREGRDLHQFWDDDPRAYLGATIAGFPNLFCLYGPNTNIVVHGASIFYVSECAANYVADAVRLMLERGIKALDVKPEAYEQYNKRVDEANQMRAWGFSKVNNWYKNRKGRVTQNWHSRLWNCGAAHGRSNCGITSAIRRR